MIGLVFMILNSKVMMYLLIIFSKIGINLRKFFSYMLKKMVNFNVISVMVIYLKLYVF